MVGERGWGESSPSLGLKESAVPRFLGSSQRVLGQLWGWAWGGASPTAISTHPVIPKGSAHERVQLGFGSSVPHPALQSPV
jgi:hypothetical protein